jgi:hypothetical protein
VGKARDALGNGKSPSCDDHRLAARLFGGQCGGVQGEIQGNGLGRWFCSTSHLAALARAAACSGRVIAWRCGWWRGDHDACRSDVYGGTVVLVGGRRVICAPPSRWLTVVAYFGVGGGGGRLVDGSMVGGAPSSFDEVNW